MADADVISPKRQAVEGDSGLGSVVASHYNSIEEKGRRERFKSRIFYLRNSNNWIKSYLISYCLDQVRDRQVDGYPISALDLGCGKGGDLLKWQKGKISHLVCADIAETSMEQCKERYSRTRSRERGHCFTAEFIVADCTKKRIKPLLDNPKRQVDIVSCQFAFHYCFESLPQAETMLRNVSENLKRGGYFVATMPSAYEIMSRMKSGGDKGRCGNEVYSIEFPDTRSSSSSPPPPLFGDKYNFFLEGVVDCPEFLVHPPTLEKLAKKWGLEVVWCRNFSTVFQDALKDTDSQYLLTVMQTLEHYPSREEQVTSSEGEYTHAQEHLQQQQQQQQQSERAANYIRTLSKSEWEALCIYQAWVFRKVTS